MRECCELPQRELEQSRMQSKIRYLVAKKANRD